MFQDQNRVIEEKKELDIKIEALSDFLDTPIFNSLDDEEIRLLNNQSMVMMLYSDILEERIKLFKQTYIVSM